MFSASLLRSRGSDQDDGSSPRLLPPSLLSGVVDDMEKRIRLAVYTDDVEAFSRLAPQYPQVEFRVEDTSEGFMEAARDAEIVYMARRYTREMVFCARQAKWLHVRSAGIDRLLPLTDFDPAMVITHTPGISAGVMADYVICAMLMLTWDIPRILQNQRERRWERWPLERVEGKTVAIIGLGNVGRALVGRARAMGMRVVGVRRSPASEPGVDRVVGPGQLIEVLGEADYVVLAVALTRETRGMIGPSELAAMKRTAYLINVSRGAVVREQALIEALNKGDIAGAALDVMEQEPLPAESPLWGLKNVILSPHISGWSKDHGERSRQVFLANLERYLTGQPLLHVVDRSQEY